MRIKALLEALLRLITTVLSVTYLVLDGHFGNHNALHMARQCNLHLISKLRGDAALYFPYTGPSAGRGPRRKYGRKVDDDNIPETYLKQTTVDEHIETRLYQAQLLHKEFAQLLMSSSLPRPTSVPRRGLMSSCSVVIWNSPMHSSWTIMACGSKSSSTSAMRNSTGAWKTS